MWNETQSTMMIYQNERTNKNKTEYMLQFICSRIRPQQKRALSLAHRRTGWYQKENMVPMIHVTTSPIMLERTDPFGARVQCSMLYST